VIRRSSSLVLFLLALRCSSAGPYGFSRVYEPLSDEEDQAEGAKEYDPIMIEREPETWKKHAISVFGIVRQRTQAAGGSAYLTLGVRTLSQRNICDSAADDSCRVTVSEHDFATVHAIAKLRPEDDLGKASLQPGALVRVIGKLNDDVDKNDGAPIVVARYYRHWPRNHFVTTADRDHMQR
jgi:hypothetical protein